MSGDSGGATLASQSSILKEIYEKKVRKQMQNPSGDGKNLPPWMQGRKKVEGKNPQMDARKKVAADRLAKLKSQGTPKGK